LFEHSTDCSKYRLVLFEHHSGHGNDKFMVMTSANNECRMQTTRHQQMTEQRTLNSRTPKALQTTICY